MKTIKEIFNANLEENITFEYFSTDGYRVYTENNTSKSYFRYKTKINSIHNEKEKIILNIDDINTMEQVKCPECQKDDYLKIQQSDEKNTRYECKNKSCDTRFFRCLPQTQTKTLDNLIKSHFTISSIKKHKEAYEKYKKMRENHTRIDIATEDIQYLEHYLLLDITRDLIAKLFSINTRTLQRFIKKEEALTSIGKSRFKKKEPLNTDKKFKLHSVKSNDKDPFKSKIIYSYIDLNYDTYEIPKYHIEKKYNKVSKK